MKTLDELLVRVESPIEKSFLLAIYEKIVSDGFEIEVQYEVPPYRLDFALFGKGGQKLCVELDGHEFHETKQQAVWDKRRDRFLMLYGWRVIRFAGREINDSAEACAKEVVLHLKHMEVPTEETKKLIESIARMVIKITKDTETKNCYIHKIADADLEDYFFRTGCMSIRRASPYSRYDGYQTKVCRDCASRAVLQSTFEKASSRLHEKEQRERLDRL